MTRRQQIMSMLEAGRGVSFDELCYDLEVTERKLREDIRSVSKTLRRQGRTILVSPALCRSCGFIFRIDRPKPSKCPSCKESRISCAKYKL